MLRLLVLLLVLLNAGYAAWTQGWLRAYGYGPAPQTEPQRLSQQLRPQAVNLLSREEARQVEAAARRQQCVQLGPFGEAQLPPLLKALAAWPTGSWRIETVALPPRWLIYMGRFADAAAVARKQAELRVMALPFEAPGSPELEPGIALGAFDTQAQAQEALAALNRRGVRTARVVQEPRGGRGSLLTVAQLDEGLRARLDGMKGVLAGKMPRPCPP